MRRGFSQVDCANYLKQCTTTREVLEVLTAYAYLCAFPAPESDRVSQCDVHLAFPLAATEQQVRSGCLHRHGFAKTTSPDLLLACHVRSFASPLARGVPLTDALALSNLGAIVSTHSEAFVQTAFQVSTLRPSYPQP